MKRIVLALLALLGIVAQAAPVSARVGGMETAQIGVVIGQSLRGASLANHQAVPATILARKAESGAESLTELPHLRVSALVATVHLRADRARE